MNSIVKLENIEDKIILIREVQALLDSDLAVLYGVSTKEVNQAVSNNPDKFPAGYIIALNKDEKNGLVKNFDRKVAYYFNPSFRERTSFPRKNVIPAKERHSRVGGNPVKHANPQGFSIGTP